VAQWRKLLAFYGRFLPSFSVLGYLARRAFWRDPPGDFRGQTWLVTGASGGIGRAIAEGALARGARVIAVARNPARLAALGESQALRREACDLASGAGVEALLARLQQPVDVLVNNVGVLLDSLSHTAEGHETAYATNLLQHYRLTEGLLRRGLLGREGVVINMSSGGMYNAPLLLAPMRDPPLPYNGVLAYALHKRAQLVLNGWWHGAYPEGPRFYVMHPGWADTAGVRTSLPRFRRLLAPLLRSAAQGADTALWLAAVRPPQPPGEHIWFDRAPRPAHVFAHTQDTPHDAAQLVAFLEEDLRRGS